MHRCTVAESSCTADPEPACPPAVGFLTAGKAAAAEERAAAAEAKSGRLEELAHTLSREVSSKGAQLEQLESQARSGERRMPGSERWACLRQADCTVPACLSSPNLQLAGARTELAAQRQAVAAAQEAQAAEVAKLRRAATEAEGAAASARQEVGALRQRQAGELEALQARFAALLGTKDATIASLAGQLEELGGL